MGVAGGRAFGEVLRSARLAAGMTQEDLAERSGLSVRAISDLERDWTRRPYFRSVRLLACALGVPEQVRAELLEAARRARPGDVGRDRVSGGRDVAGAGGAGSGGWVAPRQLPAAPAHFAGRDAELATLNGLPGRATRPGAAPVIWVIDGAAGVGKTALAVLFAHQAADRFPDGQLWVDLQGFDPHQPALTPAEALSRLLRSLGADPRTVPPELQGQAALYRTLVAGRRFLIMLDNAATAGQVQPLLPGCGTCLVVVTSRDRLGGLVARDGACRITLDVLAPSAATALLASVAGPGRAAAEPGAAGELARLCGYLPLALRIAAERVAAHPHLSLADLAAELAVEGDRLDLLAEDATTAVRAALWWSYRALPPEVARMFRLLGLHAGSEVSTLAAAALAGITPGRARSLLGALADVHLLGNTAKDRYRFHDLLRVYAAERARSDEPEDQRNQATRRMLTFYLRAAYAADLVLSPHRDHWPTAPPGQHLHQAPAFASHSEALHWFDTEHANLVAATRQANDTGEHAIAWELVASLSGYFVLRRPGADWVTVARAGLASARAAGHQAAEAYCLNILGIARDMLGQHTQALTHYQQAQDICQQAGDRRGQFKALLNAGISHLSLGRPGEALRCHQHALAACQELGIPRAEASALLSMADDELQLGQPGRAIDHCQRGLAISRDIGDLRYEGEALSHIAESHRQQGHYDLALRCYQQALSIRRDIGDRYGQAETLIGLGSTLQATGKPHDAHQARHEARAILTDLGDPAAADIHDRTTATTQVNLDTTTRT